MVDDPSPLAVGEPSTDGAHIRTFLIADVRGYTVFTQERLVSASRDGVVRVWALDLDELVRIAQRELTRGFTVDECRQYRIDPCG